MTTKKAVKGLLVGLAVVFVAIQFVPVERTNPIGAGGPDLPPDLQWTLRRACYDCHSNESRWPVWAFVAPISWQVVADVNKARAVLNFSEWTAYDPGIRLALRSLVNPVVASHRMPLWHYLPLHPDARMSPEELQALQKWSESAAEELAVPAE